MKIFDLKFLLILGLSLVIYLIYIDLNYLRDRVNTLEKIVSNTCPNINNEKITGFDNHKQLTNINESNTEKLKNELNKLSNSSSPEIKSVTIIPPSNSPKPLPKLSPKSPPKIISIDISPKDTVETKPNNNQVQNTDTESSDSSSSSKHLAIYSNDNDQYADTQNSLIESIESHKIANNIDFNYDMSMSNLNTNVDDIINNIINEEKSSQYDDIISEKEKQLQALIQESTRISVHTTEVETSESNSSESSKSSKTSKSSKSSVKLEKLSESITNNIDNKSWSVEKLEKLKLPEIKKIAEQKGINITKKTNGQQKPKNKSELINDIMA